MEISCVNTINQNSFYVTPHVTNKADTDEAKHENINAANRQECEIVAQLNDYFKRAGYNLFAVWSNSVNGWNPTIDRAHGDIYIYITSGDDLIGPIQYIDLKVTDHGSQYNNLLSTITRESYDEFTKYANHLYLCMNSTGSNLMLIDAARLKTAVNMVIASGNDPWTQSLYHSNNRSKDFLKGKWLTKVYDIIKAL